MISILIPVFNVAVYSLVQELSEQLKTLKTEGEILVYDDASKDLFKDQNNSVTILENVFYRELEKNYGRIGIRQLLAENAKYDWLLFLDCDSTIINKDYLDNYLQALTMEFDVCAGGTVYPEDIPAACNKRLHWKYGTEREAVKGSSNAFHTNNFCIRKEVFLQLNFPLQLSGYGHEDTWMEIELNRDKKNICFINNSVLHEGLEDTPIFLEKTKNALKNLLSLATIFGEGVIRDKVSLYNLFYWQKKFGLSKIISLSLKKKIDKIESNLKSCNPSIIQFDLYRLYYLIQIANEPSKRKENGKS